MQSLLILGRQPELGLAELESLYGADKLTPVGSQAVLVDVDPCLLAYDRLGGSTRFTKVLTTLKTSSWDEVERFLLDVSPNHSSNMPEGKMYLGLSLIGFNLTPKAINATGFKLKKAISKTGRPVRFVPNKDSMLSSAQVIHNKLVSPHGWELVIIKNDDQTIIAQTVKVQDIESYAQRDHGRPKRDPKVGMLPPKLAQIIINLSVGMLPEESRQSVCEIPPDQPIPFTHLNQMILDPFCGTGVILQEALLMGYNVYGSDLDPRMVDYSEFNIKQWLLPKKPAIKSAVTIETGDATNHKWSKTINFIASESYLGLPFTTPPNDSALNQAVKACNDVLFKFLANIAGQLEPQTRICLAIPAWQIRPNQFKHLPLIDQIDDLGYNRVSFEHVLPGKLIYYRPGQIVARELLVLKRK